MSNPKIKAFTKKEIVQKNEFCNYPVTTDNGECFVVKSVRMHLDEQTAEIDSVTDIAVFATEEQAYTFASKMTRIGNDACSCDKYMYTVGCRRIER